MVVLTTLAFYPTRVISLALVLLAVYSIVAYKPEYTGLPAPMEASQDAAEDSEEVRLSTVQSSLPCSDSSTAAASQHSTARFGCSTLNNKAL